MHIKGENASPWVDDVRREISGDELQVVKLILPGLLPRHTADSYHLIIFLITVSIFVKYIHIIIFIAKFDTAHGKNQKSN